jgi:hypothetical protein
MARRLELHALLVNILGTNHVYFQPPPNTRMEYPCIVYNRDYAETAFANDKPYKHMLRYQVTYIDRNPDSDIPSKLAELPMCLFDRFYAADNLNHDVYKIFF